MRTSFSTLLYMETLFYRRKNCFLGLSRKIRDIEVYLGNTTSWEDDHGLKSGSLKSCGLQLLEKSGIKTVALPEMQGTVYFGFTFGWEKIRYGKLRICVGAANKILMKLKKITRRGNYHFSNRDGSWKRSFTAYLTIFSLCNRCRSEYYIRMNFRTNSRFFTRMFCQFNCWKHR